MKSEIVRTFQAACFTVIVFWFFPAVCADSVAWKGYNWSLKSVAAVGPGPNNWNDKNIFIDTNGYLHMQIVYDEISKKWNCAELYTTNNLGFGTYQWQIEGGIDTFDPWIVLGLFPYGPPFFGEDGNNEIDIEYSRWGNVGGTNGWWTVYPDSGKILGQKAYRFALNNTYTTSRFIWNKKEIKYVLMDGFQPVGTTKNVIHSWNYAPTNFSTQIPQHAMPLHMNLWLFEGHAPANGQPVEVVIHDFVKVD